MAVSYVLVERGNPQKPEEPKKFYAQAKSTGSVTLKELGKEITQRSTVNHADTLAVLEALTQVLADNLSAGKIVRLGDFGTFQIAITSDGAETEKEFTSNLVKNPKVAFRAGNDLKDMLKVLKYERG